MLKANYHFYKGLRRRGHRLKTHGTVHGAESGRFHVTRLNRDRRSLDNSRHAGSPMRASIILVQKRANPALRAFFHSRNDRKTDTIHCSRCSQRRVGAYPPDAATSATGYTSEDYSDAARQLSGQAHGGAGKRETLHLILQNSISLEILIRVPLHRYDSDLHLEMNDSVSYRKDKATPTGFTLQISCDGDESASQRN